MSTLTEVRSVGDLNHQQVLALVNKLGGLKNAKGLLRGDLEARIEKVARLLVDKHGRGIHQPSVTGSICDQDSKYSFGRLPTNGVDWPNNFDWACILANWEKLFGQKPGLTPAVCESLLAALKRRIATWPKAERPQIANLLKGAWFPVLLPRIPSEFGGDYGAILEKFCLPALTRGYTNSFPRNRLSSCLPGSLVGQVKTENERLGRLMADLAKGQIFGIICYPFQGFSIFAQRQMAELMPDFISLMGPVEACVATATFPQQLAHSLFTPVQECSAVFYGQPGNTLLLAAYNDSLEIRSHHSPDMASDKYTGGFFIRGSRPYSPA